MFLLIVSLKILRNWLNLIRNYYNILDIIDYDKIPFYFELFERKFVLDNNGVRKFQRMVMVELLKFSI